MKTLSKHNSDCNKRYSEPPFTYNGRTGEPPIPHKNGIACDLCGHELMDTNPMMTLTSDPPQKTVKCSNSSCNFTGYRLV